MNKFTLSLFAALALTAASGVQAQGLADTPANRAAQADRYLQAMPPKEIFATMTKAVAQSVPAGPQRDQMLKMFSSGIDMDAIAKAQKDALVKHLTADEIKAQADFYSSPLGKSSMAKMGDVSADLAPVMQAQMMKAMGQGGAPGQ